MVGGSEDSEGVREEVVGGAAVGVLSISVVIGIDCIV